MILIDQGDKSNQANATAGATERATEAQNTLCETFIAQLTQQERMLILLQKELYEGNWDAMLSDLKNRLQGKPYIFKLVDRIQDDISRIGKLRDFEQKHSVNLTDYVKPDVESDVEPDAKSGVEPDAKSGVGSNAKPDVEPCIEPDVKLGAKPDRETDH